METTRSAHFGFTLLELTAVVCLSAIAFAALVPNLVRRSDAAANDRLIMELIDLDARARLNAPRHGACSLTVDVQKNLVVLTGIQVAESVVLGLVSIPDRVVVALDDSRSAISFDQSGHTTPYGYEIQSRSAYHRVRFNGHTGWHVQDQEGDR